MSDPIGSYSGVATINGRAADASVVVQANVRHGLSWSGSAFILNPAVNLLEFRGLVELVVGERTATVEITDATPGNRYIYFRGLGLPPFECRW